MFQCQIELLINVLPENSEADYITVAKYDFEPPDLQVGKEVWVHWEVWDKLYSLKCKVTGRKNVICSKGTHPDYKDKYVFLLRIFLETEDREDKLQEIKENLKKHNPHLK
ncbi:hypothetical protein [Nostoc sp. UHCC 0251]|uniref:hypothetical protein n=1 Tax=Nostoc sp. UHCC 0251 TaxID=3110240 RepID=UPI002B215F66|nr:hypothetical protein [Nostoc sp. UHCC 0251]MEA5625859.1 hypothetical protein [Nostoc sp. UHCC 0251]